MLVARKHPVVPDHFETERLLIRAPQPGDGPAINAAVVESIDDLRPWMPWAQTTQSVAEQEARPGFVGRPGAQAHRTGGAVDAPQVGPAEAAAVAQHGT